MPCPVCLRFPVPTTKFEELEINEERWGIEMERSPRFSPSEELRKYYKAADAGSS